MPARIPRPPAVFNPDGSVSMPVRRPRSDWEWTKVDIEDFQRFGGLPWCLNRLGYVVRGKYVPGLGRPATEYLHRLVLPIDPGSGLEVDHINRDPLDNRRSNLRQATHTLNMQNRGMTSLNTSGHTGVCFWRLKRLWKATITENGSIHHLGYFKNKIDAVNARKSAEAIYRQDRTALSA